MCVKGFAFRWFLRETEVKQHRARLVLGWVTGHMYKLHVFLKIYYKVISFQYIYIYKEDCLSLSVCLDAFTVLEISRYRHETFAGLSGLSGIFQVVEGFTILGHTGEPGGGPKTPPKLRFSIPELPILILNSRKLV